VGFTGYARELQSEGETILSSSAAAVYVDETLVAYETKKLFHEAAKRFPKRHEVDFFDQGGSLKCLARAVVRRISDQRTISFLKKADIRRGVEKFLRYLRDEGWLKKPKAGRNHGKWAFYPSCLNALEVVGSENIPNSHDQSAPPAEHTAGAKCESNSNRTRSGGTERNLSYINDSQRHRLRHA
jgi:hypothetical protein